VVKAGPLARVMAREISPASAFTTTSAASIFFVLPVDANKVSNKVIINKIINNNLIALKTI
jgi:hypothetical protein